ncbi:MAG: hypothetical protein HYS18_07280 [Burkholderiales bacterium]|nr:hypothetical protein [Burkholderiales bacterium]
MIELPPGLVLWPQSDVPKNRMCVLISDTHCTDCTVGNQTAEETDWERFFDQVKLACRHPVEKDGVGGGDALDELLLILNGDIVDLIRSSRWAEAGVYPWNRDDPRFADIVLAIMRDIVTLHAETPKRAEDGRPYSGFFYWLRDAVGELRSHGIAVTIVPIVGNHDKELQVVPAARQMFYEECLGMTAAEIPPSYRAWVAAQLGAPDEAYPRLPIYFADLDLRLLATHGQWRDADNIRPTARWNFCAGWQPQRWREEEYLAFAKPCFGDTVAAGLLSHFIWNTRSKMPMDAPGTERISNILDEMDLFRPSAAAVVCLLKEARSLSRKNPADCGLRDTILTCFSESVEAWLGHKETWQSAPWKMRISLAAVAWMRHFKWYWVNVLLMELMAKAQEPELSIADKTVLKLPAFQSDYRALGFRLHVEGHTHVALQSEARFRDPRERRNYTYINLGAWRDAIVPKLNRGHRRRGIGRALHILDLSKLRPAMPEAAFRYYVVDILSWGDRRDRW